MTMQLPEEKKEFEEVEKKETYLILDQQLDTLNGSSSSLRDGGRDTTHCYRELALEILYKAPKIHRPSADSSSTGDRDHLVVEERDILKKSITKGGLEERMSV